MSLRNRRSSFVPLLFLLVLLASACGRGSEEAGSSGDTFTRIGNPSAGMPGGSDPEEPVSSTPGSGGGGVGSGKPRFVEPRPGMAGIHRLGWDSAHPRGKRTVDIHFYSGVEPCYVLDHVDIDYRRRAIVVTLFEGNDDSEGEQACIEIAEFKAVRLHLDEAIRGRPIKDGTP